MDYLSVTIWFLINLINPFLYTHPLNFSEGLYTGRLSILLTYIAYTFIMLMVIRTKWTNPSSEAHLSILIYPVVGFISFFGFSAHFIGNWWLGSRIFNLCIVISNLFIIYSFISTSTYNTKDLKLRVMKKFWIGYFMISTIQYVTVSLFTQIPNIPLQEERFIVTVFVYTCSVIGAFLLIFLHVFFPEAVLITAPQICRIQHKYRNFKPGNTRLSRVGLHEIIEHIGSAVPFISPAQC